MRALLLLLVACGTKPAPAKTQVLWRVDLPGAIPQSIGRDASGAYAIELTLDAPLALPGKTLAPRHAGDTVVVTMSADGQPTGGDYGTIPAGDPSILAHLALDPPVHPLAAIALDDGGAIVGGTCDDAGKVGCLVRVSLR